MRSAALFVLLFSFPAWGDCLQLKDLFSRLEDLPDSTPFHAGVTSVRSTLPPNAAAAALISKQLGSKFPITSGLRQGAKDLPWSFAPEAGRKFTQSECTKLTSESGREYRIDSARSNPERLTLVDPDGGEITYRSWKEGSGQRVRMTRKSKLVIPPQVTCVPNQWVESDSELAWGMTTNPLNTSQSLQGLLDLASSFSNGPIPHSNLCERQIALERNKSLIDTTETAPLVLPEIPAFRAPSGR